LSTTDEERGLRGVVIPGWLPGMADALIDQAEDYLGGADGKTRKQWVKDTLKSAARAHDIKGVPDWIERPAEDLLIDLVIECVYSFKFRTLTPEERSERRENRKERRAKKKEVRQLRRTEKKSEKEV
jgi:hypothetical protein